TAGMTQFMSERGAGGPGGQRYNREGLYAWAKERFPNAGDRIREDDFRTQSRQKLRDLLLEVSKASFPATADEGIDEKLQEVVEGSAGKAFAEEAQELSEWVKATWNIDVPAAQLTGLSADAVADRLHNAFDRTFRPEMQGMERGLVLNQQDTAWKNHLYE